jgi:hypothetical protein
VDALSSIGSLALLGADGEPLRRPIVYLDWSTLSDAFLSQRPGEPPNADLASLVRRLAGRGTLCYSVTHLIELIAMNPRESALSLARSLEQLDHRWFTVTETEEQELVEAVRRQLGVATELPRLPVHLTMMAAMRENLESLTPGGTVDILSDPTIPGYVRKAHGHIESSGPRQWTVAQFARLHADRSTLPSGTTSDQVREVTFAKFVRWLKVTARDALHAAPIIIGSPPPGDAEIDAAVDQLLADPAALPMNKIVNYAHFRIGEIITDQTAGSNKFNQRYSSFLWDLRHLVAAAFADVFTCDAFVDRVLDDFRTARGLPKQLSIGRCGGVAGFVAALADQVDAAERAFPAIIAA